MLTVNRRSNYRVTFAVIAAGGISFSLMQSLVAPVLTVIQHRLHTTQGNVTWILTAYLLSAAVFTPILGRIGDIAGKKKMFVLVLGTLGVGSILSAVAPNLTVMIISRAIQGAGGAVLPLGFGIIRDEFPPEKVAGAVATVAAFLGVGSGLGLVLAGPIVELLDYHWLFWFPAIVIGLGTLAACVLIPESPVRSGKGVNWFGGLLLSAWLVALLFGVSKAPDWGWGSAKVIGLFAASVVLVVSWVVVEARAANPVIDMAMMRLSIVWRTNLVTALFGAGMYAAFAFFPEFVQTPRAAGYGLGASVTESGLIYLPAAMVMLLVGPVSASLARRFGYRAVVFTGSVLAATSFLLISLAAHQVWLLLLGALFMGGGLGLSFPSVSSLIVAAVPADQTGVANGINANIRTIGGAIGAALMSSLVTTHLQADGYPQRSGYVAGWILVAALAAVGALVALTFPAHIRRRVGAVDPPDTVASTVAAPVLAVPVEG